MSGLLFIHGGQSYARQLYRDEGRADWSQALPVVLEKHGVLDVEPVTAREFTRDPSIAWQYAGLLLAELPPADHQGLLSCLRETGRPALFGEPVPAAMRAELGIMAARPMPAQAAVVVTDPSLRAGAERYGHPAGGRVGPSVVRQVDRAPNTNWDRLPVPLTSRQAEVWARPAVRAERWEVAKGAQVLAEIAGATEPAGRSPAVVRRGRSLVCSFGLFTAVVRAHSSEPWAHGEYRSDLRSIGLETLLLALVDMLYGHAGEPRPRIRPWPRGASWALTIRHDVDRQITEPYIQDLIARHARVGTRATWYWRAQHLRWRGSWRDRPLRGRRAIRRIAQTRNHEIAHHTEQLWDGAEREQRLIERAAGRPVLGTSAHGDPSSFRYQGAPNVLWAERQRLMYTELLQHAHYHPHRFIALRPDGVVEASSVICLPHHESFDRSTVEGDTSEARIETMARQFREVGGLLQVMNHPDLNVDSLFAILGTLPRAGRLDCTAAQAVDWWRKTHVSGELTMRSTDRALELRSRRGVSGVVIEWLLPGGSQQLKLVNVPADAAFETAVSDGRRLAQP